MLVYEGAFGALAAARLREERPCPLVQEQRAAALAP